MNSGTSKSEDEKFLDTKNSQLINFHETRDKMEEKNTSFNEKGENGLVEIKRKSLDCDLFSEKTGRNTVLDKISQKIQEYFPDCQNLPIILQGFSTGNQENEDITVWILCFFAFIQEDLAILKQLIENFHEKIQKSTGFFVEETNKNCIADLKAYLKAELERNNSQLISKLINFFIEISEKEKFSLQIMKKTLRKLRFSFSSIPFESIKNAIYAENYVLLNFLLFFRDKSKENCFIDKERQRILRYKLVDELVSSQMKRKTNTNKHELMFELESYFIQSKLLNLSKILLHFSKKLIKNPSLTIEAIETEFPEYVFKCLKYKKSYAAIFLREQVFFNVIQALKRPRCFQDIVLILYLTRKYFKHYTNLNIKLLVDQFESIIATKSIEIFTYCTHPIGVIVVICEILRLFSLKNKQVRFKIDNISKQFLDLAVILLRENKEISVLTHLILKPMVPKPKIDVKVIDILMQEPTYYKDILSIDFMATILQNQLCDGYKYDYNFLNASTGFQYIKSFLSLTPEPNNKVESNSPASVDNGSSMAMNQIRKVTNTNVFKYIQKANCSMANENNHIYTFMIFIRNVNLRILIGFFLFFILMCELFYEIYSASQLSSNASNTSPELIAFASSLILPEKYRALILENLLLLPTEYRNDNTLYQKYIANNTLFQNINNKMSMNDFNPAQDCYFLLVGTTNTKEMGEYIDDCILSSSSLKSFYENIPAYLISLALILIVSFEIYTIKFYLFLKRYKNVYISTRSVFYHLNFFCALILIINLSRLYSSLDVFTIEQWIQEVAIANIMLNIQIFLLMMLFLFYLAYEERLGRVIQLIILVVKEIFRYCIVLALLTFYMGLSLHVFFAQEYSQFKALFDCVKMAFEGLLGSFNFIESNEGIGLYIYFSFCAVYALICNTVFLNLTIAVLNNIYQKFHALGRISLIVQSYDMNKTHGYHKYYSSMVSAPPPFNLFSLPIGIVLMMFKKQKLNEFFLKIYYFFFGMIPYFLLFLVCGVFITPFAWIKIIILLLSNSYKSYDGFKYKIAPKYTLLHTTAWCLFGLVYLFFVLFANDIPNFIRSCFLSIDNRIKLKPIAEDDWKLLKKSIVEMNKNGKKLVDKTEFSQFLIEKFIRLGNNHKYSNKITERISGLKHFSSTIEKTENLMDVQSPNNNVSPMTERIELEKNAENLNILSVFREKFKAEQLFQRFVEDGKINMVKMQILIEKIKKMSKKKRVSHENKLTPCKKAYFWINLINLTEFSEATKKWERDFFEEQKIISSFDY